MIEPMLDNLNGTATMTRGVIIAIDDKGLVEVQVNPKQDNLFCRILVQGEQDPTWLNPGAEVLISNIPSDSDDGVVLGRIGEYQTSEPATRTIEAKQIIIEAGDELELRCGKGTIKIQKDGKIVIRGENILNKAKGTNRIKGGSVGIN